MKILNLAPFVKTARGDIGIAAEGTFASTAWVLSEELFKGTMGTKFDWLAPDGNSYTDHRDIMSRPTEEEVLNGMSPAIKQIALEKGYIEET
jgi:hypothetical protein